MLRPCSRYVIDITVRTTPLKGDTATSVDSALGGADREVSPASLRTLVRPIGIQLGLL